MNAFTLRIGDIIHLNIPVNGHVEGVVLQIDVLRLPADEPADPTDYNYHLPLHLLWQRVGYSV